MTVGKDRGRQRGGELHEILRVIARMCTRVRIPFSSSIPDFASKKNNFTHGFSEPACGIQQHIAIASKAAAPKSFKILRDTCSNLNCDAHTHSHIKWNAGCERTRVQTHTDTHILTPQPPHPITIQNAEWILSFLIAVMRYRHISLSLHHGFCARAFFFFSFPFNFILFSYRRRSEPERKII